jgi:hypothetical protein
MQNSGELVRFTKEGAGQKRAVSRGKNEPLN